MQETPDVELAEAHNDFVTVNEQMEANKDDEQAVAKLQREYWRTYGELVKATRYGFELPPWSEQEPLNFTDENIFDLYLSFDGFLKDLKKNTGPSPQSPSLTEPPLSEPCSTTNASSDST